MKYKEAKSTIINAKKTSSIALLFLTTLTLTACSINFKKDLSNKVSDAMNISTETTTELTDPITETIDASDITNEEDLSAVAKKIKDTITEATDKNSELKDCAFEAAKLVRVVDGDTIVVEIDGDYEAKVRLIGIDTPESVASKEYLDRTGKENTTEGVEASDFTKALLADYDYVYLEKDTSDTDRYDRKLRYVWLEIPEDSTDQEQIKSSMLNAMLLDAGVANVATYTPDVKNADTFVSIAHDAQAEKYADIFEELNN